MRRHLGAVVGREDGLAECLLRNALLERMDYDLARGAYLDAEANALIGKVRSRAHACADDAGLVDESELLALLPDGDWRGHWPVLRNSRHRANRAASVHSPPRPCSANTAQAGSASGHPSLRAAHS